MILPSSVVVGVLFAVAVYLLLSMDVQRVALGFLLLSNAVNLLVLTAGGIPDDAVPSLIVDEPGSIYADPLPQAFILTAIVIGLGTAAWLLAMALGLHRASRTGTLHGPEGS